MSVVPERLREAREKKNLKQKQVMERTGINNKTLSGYENGVSEPDLDTMNKLADLYDVTVDWLSGRVNNPKQSLSPNARTFTDIIKLSDQEAIEKLKSTFVYDGKELTDDVALEIIKYARFRASEGK